MNGPREPRPTAGDAAPSERHRGGRVPAAAGSDRTGILAELRSRMRRVRGTMNDEVFETLLERMADQRLADELRAER